MLQASKILMVVSFGLLIALTILFLWYYPSLPKEIPTHFDLNGNPDGYGKKKSLFFLQWICYFQFFILYTIYRNPNSVLFNVPKSLKEKTNFAKLMVSNLSLIIMILFFDIAYESIEVAIGKSAKVSNAPIWILGSLFVTLFIYLWYNRKLDKKASL